MDRRLLLYTLLAGVSVYLIAVGQPSCGCFGRVEVSPWISFSLDMAAVTLLIVFRPANVLASRPIAWQPVAAMLALGGLVLAATSETAGRELARLRGEALLVTGGDADAGTAPKASRAACR